MKLIKFHAGQLLVSPEQIASIEWAFDRNAAFLFMTSGNRYVISLPADIETLHRLIEGEQIAAPKASTVAPVTERLQDTSRSITLAPHGIVPVVPDTPAPQKTQMDEASRPYNKKRDRDRFKN